MTEFSTEDARGFCRELLKLNVTPYRARKSLEAQGFEPDVIEEVAREYTKLYSDSAKRNKQRQRVIGVVMAIAGGTLFLYFAFFAFENASVVAYPFLGAAIWGMLKAMIP